MTDFFWAISRSGLEIDLAQDMLYERNRLRSIQRVSLAIADLGSRWWCFGINVTATGPASSSPHSILNGYRLGCFYWRPCATAYPARLDGVGLKLACQ